MERVVWRWHHHLICIVVVMVPLFPVAAGERPLPVLPDRVVPMWQTGSQVTDGKQERRDGRAAGS